MDKLSDCRGLGISASLFVRCEGRRGCYCPFCCGGRLSSLCQSEDRSSGRDYDYSWLVGNIAAASRYWTSSRARLCASSGYRLDRKKPTTYCSGLRFFCGLSATPIGSRDTTRSAFHVKPMWNLSKMCSSMSRANPRERPVCGQTLRLLPYPE